MIKYYVDPTTRLVRTCDGTDTFKPTGTWREVTLAEWETFRKETKRMKRK